LTIIPGADKLVGGAGSNKYILTQGSGLKLINNCNTYLIWNSSETGLIVLANFSHFYWTNEYDEDGILQFSNIFGSHAEIARDFVPSWYCSYKAL
jgi:hypothetical protein